MLESKYRKFVFSLYYLFYQFQNFSANTDPEMQTNIPEGMIPKEVVARNRNRQVGVQKNCKEFDTESAIRTIKKTGAKDYDSDEE